MAEADPGQDLAGAPALGWRSTLLAPKVSTQNIKGNSSITRRGLGRDRVGWTAPFQPPWPAHANSILESWVLHLPFGSSGWDRASSNTQENPGSPEFAGMIVRLYFGGNKLNYLITRHGRKALL